jgi:CheY-like chemotaxis protein
VRSSADSLLHIINDILDFSRIEAGHLRFDHAAFDLAARLAATLELLGVTARRKGLEFVVEQEPGLPPVLLGDAGRFGQVLMNLVGNAIKFTEQGSVRVEVKSAPSLPGDSGNLARLRVTIRDTGIGIPADKHALIFEAFTQADGSTSRRFGGTGLGLSIVASIVKRMGGTFDVQSEPGRGSAFSVELPFERGVAVDLPILSSDGLSRLLGHPDQGPSPTTAQAPLPLSILLVEDNPVNQRLAQEILRRRGHRVTVAENGRRALDRLAETGFDVVLMDVQMPEMNGLDATRAIRAGEAATGRHVPIVAMTAHAMAGDRERCLESGMDDYLTKPVRAEALISHVERYAMTPDTRPMDAKASAAPAHQVPSAHSAIPAQPDAAFDLDEALQRVDGDLELLVEIAGIFLADAPGMLADVAAAVGRRDAPDVSRAAHRLKGSILTFSAPAAAAAALSLETAGRDGNLTTADTDLAALTTAMARLQTELGRLGRDQAQARKSA